MKIYRLLTLALWGWCCLVYAQPGGSAEDWLQKMASALRSLNYEISYVVLQPNGEFEPYLWRHALVDGVEMEHLSLQNGPGREIVRVGDLVSYFEPNVPAFTLRSDLINGPLPSELFRKPHALDHAYDFVMIGRSRVSGRSAQQLRIVSKDKSRYGFNLWLDQETGLLLKLDMTDVQGDVLEQVQVTSLQVTAEPDDYFFRIEKAKLPELIDVSDTPQTPSRWQIGWMPQGMQLLRRDIHRLPMTGQLVEYALLSDGMVDVSVYLQAVAPGSSENGWLRFGANTLLSIQQGGVEVTVVGKVPPQTASSIANSITLVQGHD